MEEAVQQAADAGNAAPASASKSDTEQRERKETGTEQQPKERKPYPPYVRFTEEEMQAARDVSVTELAEALGYTVKRVGTRYHSALEMDSLMIKDDRTWRRYSNGKHGDSITFVEVFMEKPFPEAVRFLLAFSGKARDSPDRADVPSRPAKKKEPPKQTPFSLPIAWTDHRCVNAYLRGRGIAQ